ncbi:MAG: hypothetical protein ACR2LE_03285 [Nocardioidaceae bacterium]
MHLTKIVPGISARSIAQSRSTNPKLALAMSAAPGVDQAIRMVDDLDHGVQALLPAMTFEDVDEEIRKSLAGGNGVPIDTLDRYAQAVAVRETWQAASRQLNGLYSALAYERDNLVQNSLSTMCAALNDDLQRVYAELRPLMPYPASADAAIAQGKVAQYQNAAALRAEYSQIRAAQRLLLTGLATTDDALFQHLSKGWPLVAHASSLGAIWPDLPEWHRYGKKLDTNGQPVRLTPPWPDPDSEAFLDWLLEHPEAGPWVPDFDQAAELINQIVKESKTLYVTTRTPDEQAEADEYDRRKRMWSQPVHVVRS